MKHFLKVLLGFGFVSIGVLMFSKDSLIASEYNEWYASAPSGYKTRFPENFVGLVQYICFVVWILIGSAIYWALDRPPSMRERLRKFNPEFYEEISDIFQTYFNDRLHEIYRNTLNSFLKQPVAHESVIIDILYKMRTTLMRSFKSAEVRVAIFIPQDISGDTRLRLEYWANDNKHTPKTRKNDITFRRREGYAGYAWDSGRPQSGGKKKYFMLPEIRYQKTSVDQERVKSFCTIPIFDEGPVAGQNSLIAVVSIDADKKMYFPFRRRRFEEFVDTLRPFLILINFHLTYREKLVAEDADRPSSE